MRPSDDLGAWLIEHAALPLAELHEAYCRKLVEDGLPIWRVVLGTERLHPEELGTQLIWLAEENAPGITTPSVFYHGVERTSSYLNSPLRIVDETGLPFRCRLDEPVADMPLLQELRDAGATDYLMVPFPFLDRDRSASLSFATRAADGFSDAEIERLQVAARLLSPYAERHVLRQIAIDLLDTYVGHHAGERIYNGRVQRGAIDRIDAAILMADLRGFTSLSNAHGLTHVVEMLNAWFECVAAAVEANDGEILKFMGDGLLAIFPAEVDAGDACRRAAAAALQSRESVDALNVERSVNGGEAVEFVVGLHVGEVAYGNIGGRRRLDFTVLGPAVNYASRLQDLAKSLDRSMLLSETFSNLVRDTVVDLGRHPLRGIGDAERIFALPHP